MYTEKALKVKSNLRVVFDNIEEISNEINKNNENLSNQNNAYVNSILDMENTIINDLRKIENLSLDVYDSIYSYSVRKDEKLSEEQSKSNN